ncbi:MAG: TolC family protein [Candidatus Zixiibacteriota bacterium]
MVWLHIRRSIGMAVLFLVSGLLHPGSARAQTSLSLQDAIARGLAHNESYRIALSEKDRAEALIVSARAGVFPRIDLAGNYSRAIKRPELVITGEENGQPFETRFRIGTKHSTFGGITAEQTLFEGGGVLAAWQAARSYREMQSELSALARVNLEAEVARAFLGAILAQALADVAEQNVHQAEAHYEVVDQKFKAGLASEYDHLRAHVGVATSRPQLIQAQSALDLARTQLKNLIGIGESEELTLIESEPDSADWESEDLELLIRRADSTRPDLAALGHEVRTRARGLDVYRAERWPTLKLTGAFNWQWNTDQRYGLREGELSRSWSAGLNLSYSLFDGFRKRGMIQAARVDVKQAELRRAELARRIALEVESARNQFREATQRLEAQREVVGEAERGLSIANLRYESGVGTQLEVLDAQLALATARVLAETARHDRRVARVEWRRAMGEPVLAIPVDAGER